MGVTGHIKTKVALTGGDVSRSTLIVVPTLGGETHYCNSENYYRVYEFCQNTVVRNAVGNIANFKSCTEASGNEKDNKRNKQLRSIRNNNGIV